MLVSQGGGYLLRVVYFIVIARLLGVLQYGIVVGAFALVNLVGQYSRLGTGMVFLRYVSADRQQFAVYWGNVLVVTLTLGSFLTLLLHWLAPHLVDPASASIVAFTAIGSVLCEQLTISATQVFQAFEKMRITAVLNLLTSLARAVAAVVMLLLLHHAMAWQWAIASMAVSILVTIGAIITVTIQFGLPRFKPRLFRERAAEGFEYAFAGSTTSAYDDLDKTMLSHYGMSVENGIYAMAYRIIDMATMPIVSIQLAAEPRLFQLGAISLQGTAQLGRRLLVRSVLLSLATALLLFIFAPVVPFIVGRSFSEGVVALRWLCLIPVFRSVHHITGSVLTCAGLQRYRTATQVAAALMNFSVNLWLIPRYGWHGAAWTSLLTDGTLGLMNWTVLTRALGKTTRNLPAECA
jgi:O-antigen/teichoic acid export membrane protein